MRLQLPLLPLLLLLLQAAHVDGCPGSPVPDTSPHDSAELSIAFADSCEVVAEEMLARVRGEAGWLDPHTRHGSETRGNYTLLGQGPSAGDGAPGMLSLSRVTADSSFTDLMDISFAHEGSGGCTVQACSESQVPSYLDMSTNYCNLHDLYCGLADGCPFALHALEYVEGEPTMGYGATHDKQACVLALVGDPPATRFLSQRLDHFDRQNSRRWQQRFFVNDTYFNRSRGDAPIFLCVGGEGRPLSAMVVLTGTAHCALMVDAAKEEGALILALEHRYYGESIPVDDFSTPNLRWLSSHQALADIASLHTHISSLYGLTAANRWLTFGGSYPGMMAAWARTQYPHLIYASVSSSSPVVAQVQMQEYQDVVAYAYSNENIGGSEACLDAIKAAFAEVGRLLGTADGRASLSTQFPICEGAGDDPLSREPAQRDFVSTLSGGFNHQVNDPACGEQPGQTDLTCDYGGICKNFMAPSAALGTTPLQRLAAIFEHMSQNKNRTCIELGPDAEARSVASLVSPSLESSRRIWFYQTCAEFGYYQTCDPGTNCPFTTSPHLDRLEVQLADCFLAFGMTPAQIAANVAWSNIISGGRTPGVDRVLWVQGDVDPWYPLGVVEGPDVIMVPDASHHFWTHVAKESDQPSVKQARRMIKARIRGWLSESEVATGLHTPATPARVWASATEADRETIGDWFDEWGDHVAAKEFELAEALFADEAVGFGTWMNYVNGRDALVADQWRNVWPTISSFHHRTEDTLRVTVSTDRLFAVGLVLWTSTGCEEDGTPFERPGRTTAVFIRSSIDANWLCVHTHVSLATGVPQQSFCTLEESAPSASPPQAAVAGEGRSPPPTLLWPASSSSVTFFYSDVVAAAEFYQAELGLTPLAGSDAAAGHVDFRITSTTFLELRRNDGSVADHGAQEAKATALALITEDLDAWDAWATERGWERSHPLAKRAGSAHDGFVTVDPEGYKLEFEQFNQHPENAAFLPLLTRLPPISTALGGGSTRMSFSATISWLYYVRPAEAREFHRGTLGMPLVAVQTVSPAVVARTGSAHMADIYQTSAAGFFGAVDERNGMADWASPAAVVLSFGLVPQAGIAANTHATLRALGLEASLRNASSFSGTAIHDIEGYSMQWRVDARTVPTLDGEGRAHGTAGRGGTLLAGALLALVAAWCGWAARGALRDKGSSDAADAEEMKRMLQDE